MKCSIDGLHFLNNLVFKKTPAYVDTKKITIIESNGRNRKEEDFLWLNNLRMNEYIE